MKLNEAAFAFACALAFALAWIVCSLLVVAMPMMMSDMTGHMLHTDWQTMGWQLTFSGFVLGGIVWALVAGLIGWLIAIFYNRFSASD